VPRLSFYRLSNFKSRDRILAAVFPESRDMHAQHNKVLLAEYWSCQRLLEKSDREIAQLRARLAELEQLSKLVKQRQAEQQECSPSPPHEEKLPHHDGRG